jgi:ribosomal protein L24E
MNPRDPSSGDDESSQCFFCGKEIVPGQWFARFKQGGRLVIFCQPRCVELFLEQSPYALPEWSRARPAKG